MDDYIQYTYGECSSWSWVDRIYTGQDDKKKWLVKKLLEAIFKEVSPMLRAAAKPTSYSI